MAISKGNIYKRGQIYWFRNYVDGERKQISLHTNILEEAYIKARQIREQYSIGLDPFSSGRISFQDLITQYLSFSQSNKSKRSYERDRGILKKLNEYFGEISISKITRVNIEKYLQKVGETFKPATVNKEFNVIRAMLNKAIDWGYIKKNPAQGIKKRKVQEKPIRFLTNEEIQKILKNAAGPLQSIIITFLETGLRLGELARLTWQDINLKKEIITVQRTKSYRIRYLPISRRLDTILKELPHKESRVFPLSNDRIKTLVNTTCKHAGFLDVTCHIFRHNYGSRLMSAGVDIRTVQELMGHKNIKTTMRYLHLAPGYLKGVTEKLKYKY